MVTQPVVAGKNSRLVIWPGGEETNGGQNTLHIDVIDLLVFWRKGIDRGGNDGYMAGIDPFRHVVASRENECVGSRDEGTKKVPCTLCPFVVLVRADMASPDDDGTEPFEGFDETRSLGIVEEHDVSGTNTLSQPRQILFHHADIVS